MTLKELKLWLNENNTRLAEDTKIDVYINGASIVLPNADDSYIAESSSLEAAWRSKGSRR